MISDFTEFYCALQIDFLVVPTFFMQHFPQKRMSVLGHFFHRDNENSGSNKHTDLNIEGDLPAMCIVAYQFIIILH